MKCAALIKLAILLLVLGAFFSCLLLFAGCQSGTTGLVRPMDPQTYSTITNVITIGTNSVAPALPAPANWIAEAVGGLALAGLAFWQTLTHKTAAANTTKIAQLENGKKT